MSRDKYIYGFSVNCTAISSRLVTPPRSLTFFFPSPSASAPSLLRNGPAKEGKTVFFLSDGLVYFLRNQLKIGARAVDWHTGVRLTLSAKLLTHAH